MRCVVLPVGGCPWFVDWCDTVEECHRVNGGALCHLCGKEYRRHPPGGPSREGVYIPTFHRGCDGRLLKT